MTDIFYFQVGGWRPVINELSVNDEDEVYRVLGFRDGIDFMKRARVFRGDGVLLRYAEGRGGLVLIEGYLTETWVRDYGYWKEYERAPTFLRVVVARGLFERAGRNPVLAVRLAEEKLRGA